jgi:hypothetical protein
MRVMCHCVSPNAPETYIYSTIVSGNAQEARSARAPCQARHPVGLIRFPETAPTPRLSDGGHRTSDSAFDYTRGYPLAPPPGLVKYPCFAWRLCAFARDMIPHRNWRGGRPQHSRIQALWYAKEDRTFSAQQKRDSAYPGRRFALPRASMAPVLQTSRMRIQILLGLRLHLRASEQSADSYRP